MEQGGMAGEAAQAGPCGESMLAVGEMPSIEVETTRLLRQWLNSEVEAGTGAPVEIDDFDPGRDEVVLLYDLQAHPRPRLRFRVERRGGATRIMMNGQLLARVNGAPFEPERLHLLAT